MVKGPDTVASRAARLTPACATDSNTQSAWVIAWSRVGPTRSPPPGQDLAGDSICQRYRCETYADKDCSPDKSIDVSRPWRDAGADEGDGAGPNKQQLSRLEGVGRRGDEGTENSLDDRQNHDDPGLSFGVVQVRSNVSQLGQCQSAPARLKVVLLTALRPWNGRLTTAVGPCRATTWV